MTGAGRLTYVGHATILIELDGVALLTDPVLRGRVGYVSRIAPPVAGALDPDAILVSHAHYDHLDVPSLRRLPAAAQTFAPPAAAAVVRRTGRAVTELAAGQRGARRGARDHRRGGGPRRAADRRRAGARRDRLPGRRQRAGLLRGRHRPLRRHARPRAGHRRRAAAGLGLGPQGRARPPRSGAGGARRRHAEAAHRDPDPLGHLRVAARVVARRPGAARPRVRAVLRAPRARGRRAGPLPRRVLRALAGVSL